MSGSSYEALSLITVEPFDPALWIGGKPADADGGLVWKADAEWGGTPTDDDNFRSFYFVVEWDTSGLAALTASGAAGLAKGEHLPLANGPFVTALKPKLSYLDPAFQL